MSKKKRPDPFSEGSMAIIYEMFIKPLMSYKPENMSFREWLDDVYFNYKTVDITQYQVRVPFKMPGLFYLRSLLKIQGYGYRDVQEGTILMVRKDSTKDTYDVEFFGGPGGQEQVFELTESEWGLVKLSCDETEPYGMRKRVKAVK